MLQSFSATRSRVLPFLAHRRCVGAAGSPSTSCKARKEHPADSLDGLCYDSRAVEKPSESARILLRIGGLYEWYSARSRSRQVCGPRERGARWPHCRPSWAAWLAKRRKQRRIARLSLPCITLGVVAGRGHVSQPLYAHRPKACHRV